MFEQREPLVAWARLEGVGQSLADPAAVLGCHEACGYSRDALVGEKVADAKHAEGVGLELGGERREKQPAAVLGLVGRVARVPAARPDVGGWLRLRGHDVELSGAADHDAVDAADGDHLTEARLLAFDQRGHGRGRGPRSLHVQRGRIHQVDRSAVERRLSSRRSSERIQQLVRLRPACPGRARRGVRRGMHDDQARVGGRERPRIGGCRQLAHDAHVGASQQPGQPLLPLCRSAFDDDAALVAIPDREPGQ